MANPVLILFRIYDRAEPLSRWVETDLAVAATTPIERTVGWPRHWPGTA
jgi:hypothetical protein